MKLQDKIISAFLIISVGVVFVAILGAMGITYASGTCYEGFQGGTGICSTTSTSQGYYIQVASTTPFLTYQLSPISTSTPGLASSSPFLVGYLTQITATGTLTDSPLYSTSSNVGLGTTNPNAVFNVIGTVLFANVSSITPLQGQGLDVINNATPTDIVAGNYGVSGNTNSPAFTGIAARGSSTAPTAVQNNDILISVNSKGYASNMFSTSSAAAIREVAGDTWNDGDNETYISFFTTPASSTTKVERVRILGNGNFGIGTTTPATTLDVNGSTTLRNQVYIPLSIGGCLTAGAGGLVATTTCGVTSITSANGLLAFNVSTGAVTATASATPTYAQSTSTLFYSPQATIISLQATTATDTNHLSTNSTTTSFYATNGTIVSATATNFLFTNATGTLFFVPSATLTNATITNLLLTSGTTTSWDVSGTSTEANTVITGTASTSKLIVSASATIAGAGLGLNAFTSGFPVSTSTTPTVNGIPEWTSTGGALGNTGFTVPSANTLNGLSTLNYQGQYPAIVFNNASSDQMNFSLAQGGTTQWTTGVDLAGNGGHSYFVYNNASGTVPIYINGTEGGSSQGNIALGSGGGFGGYSGLQAVTIQGSANGNVGIGTNADTPATTLNVAGNASTTVRIGVSQSNPGCIELYDAHSGTLDYVYSSSTVLVDTSSKPGFCE